ncbi:NAD-dependent protein deacetylase sirtuin-2 isoform X2 [Venturia canescens]|uniref:NAD-dependent protein deacetylase sirtuin-2 isoform X2 n=2 Tax=Venturia canescens TaxID=32260 RepID=UPI001C9C97D2|nr:NAD-dependent protein deacetylase sirtuin-2 isoform X2 [Venturia canescens]
MIIVDSLGLERFVEIRNEKRIITSKKSAYSRIVFTTHYLYTRNKVKHLCKMDKSQEKEEDEKALRDLGDSQSDKTAGASSEKPENKDSGIEKIRKYFSEKLKMYDSTDSAKSETKEKKILDTLDLDGVVEYIKQKNCRKIITMAGAGISTSAGIPDFRSPSSGLYHNLGKYNLPHPQAIFEIDFFMENPEPFFVLAKELLPEGFKPTPSHYFIRLLWEKGLLLRHYTQNVDTLERVAGLPGEKLVEAHGTFHTGHCLKCRALYTLEWMKDKISASLVPKCDKCKEGIVKPDIVFFGEMLPERFHTLIDQDFRQADLLIIMGSSLVVQPFASLVDRVSSTCPRLLINKEKVGIQDRLTRFLGFGQGLVFDPKSSEVGRDVAWIGDCDTGCQLLADKLNWGEELRVLIKKEHERLQAEYSVDN